MDQSSLHPSSGVYGSRSTSVGGGGASRNTLSSTPTVNSGAAATAADPAEEQKQNLNQTINSIQKILGLLHQLFLTVSSFNVASQLPLLQRLNALVAELDTLQKLAENCNIQVPLEVVNFVDDGKNPDEFTKDVLNSCIAKNQITKGKTDAFKVLRKSLLEELEQAFPDEVESYRDIRASSSAEIKRLAQMQNVLSNGDVKVELQTIVCKIVPSALSGEQFSPVL